MKAINGEMANEIISQTISSRPRRRPAARATATDNTTQRTMIQIISLPPLQGDSIAKANPRCEVSSGSKLRGTVD
jgi:hypothetical protein